MNDPVTLNLDHCFRPTLVKYLIKKLLDGGAYNLYGALGTGKGRVLNDIRKTELENVRIIQMRASKGFSDYERFCHKLCDAAGVPFQKNHGGISGIIKRVKRPKDGKIFLFLENFQTFFEGVCATGYHQIQDQLNALCNDSESHCSLLMVTREPAQKNQAIVNGVAITSILNAKDQTIGRASTEDVKRELERQEVPERIATLVTPFILEQSPFYLCLEQLVSFFANEPSIFKMPDEKRILKEVKNHWNKYQRDRCTAWWGILSEKKIIFLQQKVDRLIIVLNNGKLQKLADKFLIVKLGKWISLFLDSKLNQYQSQDSPPTKLPSPTTPEEESDDNE